MVHKVPGLSTSFALRCSRWKRKYCGNNKSNAVTHRRVTSHLCLLRYSVERSCFILGVENTSETRRPSVAYRLDFKILSRTVLVRFQPQVAVTTIPKRSQSG